MADDTVNPMDVFDNQMQGQSVGCIAVSDGHVFLFTATVLEKLLEQARASENGRAVVFVKTSPKQ